MVDEELTTLIDQEFEVGLDAPEIDSLGIRSSIEGVVIVWHAIDRARVGLKCG